MRTEEHSSARLGGNRLQSHWVENCDAVIEWSSSSWANTMLACSPRVPCVKKYTVALATNIYLFSTTVSTRNTRVYSPYTWCGSRTSSILGLRAWGVQCYHFPLPLPPHRFFFLLYLQTTSEQQSRHVLGAQILRNSAHIAYAGVCQSRGVLMVWQINVPILLRVWSCLLTMLKYGSKKQCVHISIFPIFIRIGVLFTSPICSGNT